MVGFNSVQNSGKWLDFSVKINQKTLLFATREFLIFLVFFTVGGKRITGGACFLKREKGTVKGNLSTFMSVSGNKYCNVKVRSLGSSLELQDSLFQSYQCYKSRCTDFTKTKCLHKPKFFWRSGRKIYYNA